MGEEKGEFLSLLSCHHFVDLHDQLMFPIHPPFLRSLSLTQVYESIQIARVGGAAHPSAWTTVSANCGDKVSVSGCPLNIFLDVMNSPSSSSYSHPRHRYKFAAVW